MSQQKPSDADIQQITELLLHSPSSDEPMSICSNLTKHWGGYCFNVCTEDQSERFKITIRVEEI